jgi:acyl carrier protein
MPEISASQIQADIESVIRRLRPDLRGSIEPSDRLRDDLGLDSLHAMELLSDITEKYQVDVDPEELQDVRTVSDVAGFLARLLGAADAPSPAR